jgi:hypothetical protein
VTDGDDAAVAFIKARPSGKLNPVQTHVNGQRKTTSHRHSHRAGAPLAKETLCERAITAQTDKSTTETVTSGEPSIVTKGTKGRLVVRWPVTVDASKCQTKPSDFLFNRCFPAVHAGTAETAEETILWWFVVCPPVLSRFLQHSVPLQVSWQPAITIESGPCFFMEIICSSEVLLLEFKSRQQLVIKSGFHPVATVGMPFEVCSSAVPFLSPILWNFIPSFVSLDWKPVCYWCAPESSLTSAVDSTLAVVSFSAPFCLYFHLGCFYSVT